ncbi:MAG TPA: EVE domain-containing protein [Chryseolinea sp.]
MATAKYWVVVASKDHASRGVQGGFIQANHGKEGPLKRIRPQDWIIVYSPKETFEGDTKLQAFTAIGQAADDKVYAVSMTSDFHPFRRNVHFYPCREAPVAPLVDDLQFITNKKSWGFPFRFGFFEIKEEDFTRIRSTLLPQ